MERIRAGELEFKCRASGSDGPLVILLHGYGGGPLDWHHVIPQLEKNHRLIIPNLTPLFSCVNPIGYSKQVEILSSLINQVNPQREPFVLVGTSYGGTLSWGLRAHFQSLVTGHVLVNPMPLDPLVSLKSSQLRMLFGLNMVPGALPLFLKTSMGRSLLLELGDAFGFGGDGRKGLLQLSERKLSLVGKAVQRFAWIAQHENWSYWTHQIRDHLIPLLVVTGSKDPLFDEKDFRGYQLLVPMSEHQSIEYGSHLLIKENADDLSARLIDFIKSLGSAPKLSAETLRHAI